MQEHSDQPRPGESEAHSSLDHYDDERINRLAVALAAEHRGAEALVLQGMIKQGYSGPEIEAVYNAARLVNEPQVTPAATVDPLREQYNGARQEVTDLEAGRDARADAFLAEMDAQYEQTIEQEFGLDDPGLDL